MNQALWLPAKGATPEVRPAPVPTPGQGQIVIRAACVAINPIDWILQQVGSLIFPFLRYPLVLGWDVAGEVVAVGAGVSRFKVGDRIVGLAVGQDKSVNDPVEGAFQHHPLLRDHMATPIPPSLTWEQAAVLPLAISTAACCLFQSAHLALDPPTVSPHSNGKTVLIWGGSTSVGSNAIQLAVAAGYEVVTTASPRNHAYVRQLGASAVFDYKSRTVVRDIVQFLKGKTLAGAVAIGAGSAPLCVAIMGACTGRKYVAIASPPVSFDDAPEHGRRGPWLAGKLFRMVRGTVGVMLRGRLKGVHSGFVNGSSLLNDGVGRMIFTEFLPGALASGQFRSSPEPIMAGAGLEAIPNALERHRKGGVSAGKLVVTL